MDLSGDQSIARLPEEISTLVSLQYLNLSHTNILHLPMGLQELRKLIHLDLWGTSKLKLLSVVVISSLRNLKILKLYRYGFTWNIYAVEELETMEHREN